MSEHLPGNEKTVLEKEKEKSPPRRYNIVFYNDDFTPFQVVEHILMNFYNKTSEEAQSVAAKIHNEGKSIVGTYSKDLAQQKYDMTQALITRLDVMLYIQMLPE